METKADKTGFSYYRKPVKRVEFLYVIKMLDMSDAEKTMIGTLQGIIANKSVSQIYILDEKFKDYSIWLEDFKNSYKVEHEYVTSPWTLIDIFKQYICGYILYKDDDSINAACSLVGLKSAIAVNEAIEDEVRRHGIKNLVLDVRGKNDNWVKTNYWSELNHKFIIEQKREFTPYLRDYAAMSNSFVFFDGNSGFRDSVMADMDDDTACMGWGDSSCGEDKFIGPSSERGVLTIPADWGLNISVLSGFTKGSLIQKTHMEPVREENVHYVTFLMSDGDNLQWTLGNLYSGNRWWGSGSRGTFNMGWALSPSMIDLSPTVMKYYYDTASDGDCKDYFVAGPSGNGYIYPCRYPQKELEIHIERLNAYMGKTDLDIVEVIDFNILGNNAIWDKYTAQPNIKAIIYLEYINHKEHNGAVKWSNNKPVICPREMLWDGLPGCDEETVKNNLNSASTNIYCKEGYTLVLVHAWSPINASMGSIKRIIDGLNENVRVVTPEMFVKLIQSNLTLSQ